jgi:hypothetical protein
MTDRQLQVGQLVGGPDGVRVGVSVLWNKYPLHNTRQVKITVGTFLVYDAVFDEATRDRACQVHRTTVSKMLPMGLQLVCQSPLYTPGLRYFSDGGQRSESGATEWSDWALVR